MDDLRWILLGIAIVVIGAIYFLSRSRKKDQYSSPLEAANEMPSFSAGETDDSWVDGVGPVRVVSDSRVEESVVIQDETISADIIENVHADADDAVAEITEERPKGIQSEEAQTVRSPYEENPKKAYSEASNNQTSDIAESKQEQSKLDAEQLKDNAEVTAEKNTGQQKAKHSASQPVDDVISVYVLATSNQPVIKGEKILSASYALHMEHGEMNIFHRYTETSNKKIQFSMANVLEPGWFDIDNMHHLETKGISFFMQANLVENPDRVLDEMLICAHRMATMLDAQLCNAQRKSLDEAYTNQLREKVQKLMQIKTQAV